MHILVLNGSPRPNGNTARILNHLQRLAHDQGHDWQEISLARQSIHPCIGCGSCAKKGQCVFKDDMVDIYQAIARAERIIIASPIYFYGLTAQAKLCIDRCQALWSRKYILNQRITEKQGRRGYLVSVAATRGEQLFTGAVLTARYGLDAMDATYAGALLYSGVDDAGAITDHPDFPARTEALADHLLSSSPNAGCELFQ